MTNAAPEAAMSEAQQGVEDEEGSFETQGAFSARPDAQFDLDAGCFSSNDFRIWRFKVGGEAECKAHTFGHLPQQPRQSLPGIRSLLLCTFTAAAFRLEAQKEQFTSARFPALLAGLSMPTSEVTGIRWEQVQHVRSCDHSSLQSLLLPTAVFAGPTTGLSARSLTQERKHGAGTPASIATVGQVRFQTASLHWRAAQQHRPSLPARMLSIACL
jgi:hypothetical protein